MNLNQLLVPVISGLILLGARYLLVWISPLHRKRRKILRDAALLAGVSDVTIRAEWQAEINANARDLREYQNEKKSFYHWGMALYILSVVLLLWSILLGSVNPFDSQSISDTDVVIMLAAGVLFLVGSLLLQLHPRTRKKTIKRLQEGGENTESDDTTGIPWRHKRHGHTEN